MKITPRDISNKEFKKNLRGYSPEEVDEFLDDIVENYEELYKENSILKEKVSTVTEKLDHYGKIENTIQNTLLLAQNAAEQARTSAQSEAELLVKNANDTAQKILDRAHSDVVQINDEFERIKQEFIKFRAKFRNFMNTQMETFDDLEKEFIKNHNISKPLQETAELEAAVDCNEIEEEDLEQINNELNQIKSFFANN